MNAAAKKIPIIDVPAGSDGSDRAEPESRFDEAAGTCNLVQALREQVRRIEGSRRPEEDAAAFSSGAPPLDRLLPERGFVRGSLIEWLAEEEGGGAGTLALMAAREAALEGGAVVVMDRGRKSHDFRYGAFYPPAAAALGIDLESVIVIRAQNERDELWALDQALACRGVAAVWAPLERLDWRSFRRLQLAAESGGSLGLLLRPARVRGQPSWSHLQLLVSRPPPDARRPGKADLLADLRGRRLQVEITRGRTTGRSKVELEIDEVTSRVSEVSAGDETHPLHLASRLADPAPRRRPARA
jgi:hypothetical protein